MSTEGVTYEPQRAAPLVLWGMILTIAAPALVALAWATADPGNPFTGSPASPNPLFMLLGIGAGIGAAVTLTAGCWRAAKNVDYLAAVTHTQVMRESTEVGTSPR